MSKAQPDPSTGNNDGTAKKPVPCELTTAFMAEDLEALAVILTVDAGYRKLSELGSDEDSVRKNIVKQAGKKYPKGEIERAVSVCTAALPSTKPMLDLPEVPDGEEINLDQPTIKVKDINYAIPGSIVSAVAGGGKGKFRAPQDLRNKEWIVIARKNGLTRAMNLQYAMSVDDWKGKYLAGESALTWMTKPVNFIEPPVENVFVQTYVSYTEQAGSLVHASVTKGSLNIQTPFCSGLVEMGRNERLAQQKMKKVVQIGGAFQYIGAILDLKNCLTASDEFLAAVNDAVAQPTLNEQGEALQAVFDRFGHVIATRVTLGGQHYFTSTRETEGEVVESDLANNIKAAVTAQYGNVKGGAGATHASDIKLSKEAKSIKESVQYTNCGGDGTGEASLATTRDPNSWVVIAREDVVPLTEFLIDKVTKKDDLKKKVERIWTDWLKTFWGGHEAPKGYVKPDMWKENFVIRSSMDDITGRGIKAVTDNPPACAQLVKSNFLSSPIGEGLCWQLRYCGNNAASGDPVYFIEEFQSDAQKASRQAARDKRIAAMKQAQAAGLQLDTSAGLPLLRTRLVAGAGDSPKVFCQEVPEDTAHTSFETDPAGWLLVPAEPAKRRESAAGIGFYIRSHIDRSRGFGEPDSAGNVPLVTGDAQRVWYLHAPG